MLFAWLLYRACASTVQPELEAVVPAAEVELLAVLAAPAQTYPCSREYLDPAAKPAIAIWGFGVRRK
jgi:thiamine biosynthesis lipoprotein ApbE